MLIVDAHLDLAMNAMSLDRDLDLPVMEIRERERDMTQKGRGRGTVSFPEMRKGEIGLSVATVIKRTYDDRPKTVHFRFKHPLEHPRYRWMCLMILKAVDEIYLKITSRTCKSIK